LETILIVDDELPICRLLSKILSTADYHCLTAGDAQKAREVLATNRVSLLLSDINMPGESGLDLVRYALNEFPDLAAIMVSAVDDQMVAKSMLEAGVFDFITKPIDRNRVIVSVANACHRRNLEIANRRHRESLEETVAAQTESLRNALDSLKNSFDGITQVLANILETKDPYTAGHQKRVAKLAVAIASEMGLSPDEVQAIHIAGTIHDLGKISVPSEILAKPGQLSEIEFEMIKTHSAVGYNILKDIEFPWPIADIVHQHHEKLNGSGYPQGLSGNDILIEARILCVADVFEAMASHRPYRPALSMEITKDELRKNRATLYESAAVDACVSLIEEKGYTL